MATNVINVAIPCNPPRQYPVDSSALDDSPQLAFDAKPAATTLHYWSREDPESVARFNEWRDLYNANDNAERFRSDGRRCQSQT